MRDNGDIWDIEHEKAFVERGIPNGFSLPKNKACIDKNGYRHVFCVQNARGVRLYFDSSKDAFELANTSQFQPCRLIEIPVYPRWEYHYNDIEDMAFLIESEIKAGRYKP